VSDIRKIKQRVDIETSWQQAKQTPIIWIQTIYQDHRSQGTRQEFSQKPGVDLT